MTSPNLWTDTDAVNITCEGLLLTVLWIVKKKKLYLKSIILFKTKMQKLYHIFDQNDWETIPFTEGGGGGSGKSNHYLRDAIVFKKLSFQNDLRPHENAKLRIHVPPVWKSVFKKLCFRNGLVWTVRLTVEIKLCFRIFPPKGGSCCNCKDSSTEDGKCFRKISYFWSKTSGLRDWHWACNFKAFVSDSVYDRAVASLASEEQRRSVRLNCCVAFE